MMLILVFLALLLGACEASASYVVPTDLPTETATFTPSPSRTPGSDIPTRQPTQVVQVAAATGGPSPTPLFGSTRTPVPDDFPTATRPYNPNAPRIEFFASDPLSIPPGQTVTLFWSSRGVDSAVIYRLDEDGIRSQAYNVEPDGNLPITTRSSERGELRFVLTIGEGADTVEETLTIPLECPVEWFFSPSPEDCASDIATETFIIDQQMERGRLLYIEASDSVYALFNDGQPPGWLRFDNNYNPEIHPDRDPNAPLDFIQPLAQLGYVWRSDDDVRNRLGLGLADAATFEGFIQSAPGNGSSETLYISGSNGVVLQLLPGGEIWQIIGGPQ